MKLNLRGLNQRLPFKILLKLREAFQRLVGSGRREWYSKDESAPARDGHKTRARRPKGARARGAFGSGALDRVGSTQSGTASLADGTLGEISSLRKSPRQRPRLWPFWHLASFNPTCKGCRTRRAEQRRRKRMRIVLDMSGMADRPPRESPFFFHRPLSEAGMK